MPQENLTISGENVVTPKEIAIFLKKNLWVISIWAGGGLLASIAYVIITPKLYEARWQMTMAKMIVSNVNGNSNSNSNSEEPLALIQRLRSSLAYPEAVLMSCGKSKGEEIGDYLDESIVVEVVKNVPNSVEFKLRSANIEQGALCANAIVAMVTRQQQDIIRERLAGREEQLVQYEQAFKEEMRQLERLNKTELGNFAYLSKLDKLSWLRSRIDGLQEELFLSKKFPTKLSLPIAISNRPVAPKAQLILFMGAVLGVMMGLLFSLAREGWRKVMTVV